MASNVVSNLEMINHPQFYQNRWRLIVGLYCITVSSTHSTRMAISQGGKIGQVSNLHLQNLIVMPCFLLAKTCFAHGKGTKETACPDNPARSRTGPILNEKVSLCLDLQYMLLP
jgi:hypothetical protein